MQTDHCRRCEQLLGNDEVFLCDYCVSLIGRSVHGRCGLPRASTVTMLALAGTLWFIAAWLPQGHGWRGENAVATWFGFLGFLIGVWALIWWHQDAEGGCR